MTEEFEFELDEIHLGLEEPEEVDTSMPKNYLYIEKLVMLNQVKGFVEDGTDLITVPAYADKGGVPTFVGTIELTSENILTMQQLALKISLVRAGKEPILFNKAEDYMAIVKTLNEKDRVEFESEHIVKEVPLGISAWDEENEESA